jgi:hypothetical protein
LLDPANLVVIDGAGDLVPRLKRKAAVTKLLGKELVYVDMDGPALAGGFNPLAAAPGETETALVGRWQRWFEGMNVQGIQLLAQARQDGVEDIPALRKWLKQAARASSLSRSDVSNLDMTLNRLTVGLREWLEWPANRFEILPGGALFFACKGTGWARQQLLRAALLGAMQVEGVRLVVHGFPVDLNGQAQIVTSNGPLLPHSVKILTGSDPAAAAKLAAVFSNGNPLLAETLEILPSDQAILVDQGDIRLISWSKRGEL